MIRRSGGNLTWFENAEFKIGHAFFGKTANPENVLTQFSLKALCFPKQVHGTTILEVPPTASGIVKLGEGDGLVASRNWIADGYGIGVVTADCLPIILISKTSVAVIHAGWRGLAAGILEKGCDLLGPSSSALIGPAAGAERYEVGHEVIEALGDSAAAKSNGARYLLDLAQTAHNRLVLRGLKNISRIPICTISDPSFHSYRREGSAAGRNITLVYQQNDLSNA